MAQPLTQIHYRPLNPQTTASPRRPNRSLFIKTPHIVVIFVLIVILCMVIAALIIHFFDGQPAVNNHPERQPASLLAVVSSISNFSMGVLVSMGVAVSWWRSVLRG